MTRRFTGTGSKEMDDDAVRSLAEMSEVEFDLAVRDGQVPGEIKRSKPGRRRWDAPAILEWINASRRKTWSTGP